MKFVAFQSFHWATLFVNIFGQTEFSGETCVYTYALSLSFCFSLGIFIVIGKKENVERKEEYISEIFMHRNRKQRN